MIFSILLFLTAFSIYPWIQCLWIRKDSSGISAYYILFNLVAATEQFTIIFCFLVNNTVGGDLIVHTPPTTGDWINFMQMSLLWILLLTVYVRVQPRRCQLLFLINLCSFVLTLHYLPRDDLVHKGTALVIFIAFLLVSVIPELIDVIVGGPYDTNPDREFLLVWFGIPHITFINPVVTLSIIASFIIQIRRSLREKSLCLSVRILATQAVVFACLGASWFFRVLWPSSRIPAFFDSPFMEWYRQIGWPAVDHLIFSLGQAILCYITWRRTNGRTHSLSREREPLLNDA